MGSFMSQLSGNPEVSMKFTIKWNGCTNWCILDQSLVVEVILHGTVSLLC